MSLMSGPSLSASGNLAQRTDVVDALYECRHRLGMDEVWDAVNTRGNSALASEAGWDNFVERLGQALDEYWAVA
jgi:hypothetical protein